MQIKWDNSLKILMTIMSIGFIVISALAFSGCSRLKMYGGMSTLKYRFVVDNTEYLIQSSDDLLKSDIDDIEQTILLSEEAFKKNYGVKYNLPTIIINYWNASIYPGYKYGEEFSVAYTKGYIVNIKTLKPLFGRPNIATLEMQNILIHELYHVYTHSDNQIDADWFINEVNLLGEASEEDMLSCH